MTVRARVWVVAQDPDSGEIVPHEPETPFEDVEFSTLPRVGEDIIWLGNLDVERLVVTKIEHRPTYPNRSGEPLMRTEPSVSVTAKWVWVA